MMPAVAESPLSRFAVPPPAPPNTIEETGLHPDTLAQLMLKTLVAGEASGTGLSEKLRVPYSVLDALIQHARVEKLLEVRGTSGAGSAGYRYILTDLGRVRAGQFLDICRYVGPAPVPLAQYNAYVRASMEARPYLDRPNLSRGFENLVVSNGMLDQLGPAVNSGKALFLYGAPGNGKTVFAEGIGRALGGEMHVPFAIDVDGQVITMYDPVSHQRMAESSSQQSVVSIMGHDRRWECIRRPVVVVGGELTLEMLDLTFNPISRFYEAPIQMKAIGGVFVVDDFGRQRIPPRDLLNRWIVPLESRVDFLTLHTGRKFEVPFNVFIVFATNLKPESLADEAFLRRIPYKILAKNPTIDELLPHLRAELQAPRDDVRSGHGRIPGPQVLQAAEDPDARVPSTRSDFAGSGHLPLHEPRPGDYARVARLGVRQLLPRRIAITRIRQLKRGALTVSAPFDLGASRLDADRLADIAARAAIVVLFSLMAARFGADFLKTGRMTGLLLLVSEMLVVVLTVMRRSAAAVDRTVRARLLTALSMLGPPLLQPAEVSALLPQAVTVAASVVGLAIVIAGKVTLGRSFGLMPANRGIVSSGVYRVVRHPIYLGYLITHVAFLLATPSAWNIVALLAADAALLLRAVCEEQTLSRDSRYCAYQKAVRWRVCPGLF